MIGYYYNELSGLMYKYRSKTKNIDVILEKRKENSILLWRENSRIRSFDITDKVEEIWMKLMGELVVGYYSNWNNKFCKANIDSENPFYWNLVISGIRKNENVICKGENAYPDAWGILKKFLMKLELGAFK